MMKRKVYRRGLILMELELGSKVDSLLRLPNLAFRVIDISGPHQSLRGVRSKSPNLLSLEATARVLVRQSPLKIKAVVVDRSMVDLVGVRVDLGMGMEVSD